MNIHRWLAPLAAFLQVALGTLPVAAQDLGRFTVSTATQGSGGVTVSTSAPSRAGRVADAQGGARVFQPDRGEWVEVPRNRAITTGDRVSTGPDGRLVLEVGSTQLRIGTRSEVEVLQLDDQRLSLHLYAGSLAVRIRTLEWAQQIDLSTPEIRARPTEAGHYRLDRQSVSTFVGAWRGELIVDDGAALPIGAGQRLEFWRERGALQQRVGALPQDGFQAWNTEQDQREANSTLGRQVSPEMTGSDDLYRYGRWEEVPELGAVWFPTQVQAGWAPYAEGRWVWVRHWGWTWVDDQPWGFAPFHYGRWLQWRGQWAWVPGRFTHRPEFRPTPRPPQAGGPYPPSFATPSPMQPPPLTPPPNTMSPRPHLQPPAGSVPHPAPHGSQGRSPGGAVPPTPPGQAASAVRPPVPEGQRKRAPIREESAEEPRKQAPEPRGNSRERSSTR